MDNIAKLEEFGNFDDNWDGYGAPKYDEGLLNNLKYDILPNLIRQPQIFPSASGCVQLEYRGGKGLLALIRYTNDDMLETAIIDLNKEGIVSHISNNIKDINEFISDYYC